MEPDFWRQRWSEGRIGFHQPQPSALLCKHWPALALAPGARVLVPLCGKSHDLAWLAGQGHQVLGVELVREAVEAFFAEHALAPEVRHTPSGTHYSAGGIEIVCGDVFALQPGLVEACDAAFDRAALVALPHPLRRRYIDEVYARLPRGCRGLLVTLEYDQAQREGPPFSVDADEVQALSGRDWHIDLLERRPIPPDHPGHLAGADPLQTAVWRLERR